jgi:broad specificity polyphosphatase/5'/3'-nucleotidase SurE
MARILTNVQIPLLCFQEEKITKAKNSPECNKSISDRHNYESTENKEKKTYNYERKPLRQQNFMSDQQSSLFPKIKITIQLSKTKEEKKESKQQNFP